MSSAFTVAPPSTLSACRRTPESRVIASSTARVWKQIASRVARARWALVWNRERPTMTPRASARQYGAKSPENAGTKYRPALSGTLAASASISSADLITSS